jgi:hypothetical protein
MSRELYMACTGCSNIISVQAGGDYHGPCQTALVDCESTTLTVGDAVEVNVGFSDDHSVIVHGYAKEINPTVPDGTYRIRVYDDLILAQDYLVVSDDPNAPLTYENIQAEDLVGNVLALASLTNYSGDHPGFTFGTQSPVKVQLVKAWDFVRQVSEMLAWWVYCDPTGTIHFVDRKPYPVGGDSSIHTFETGDAKDLTLINYSKSDDKMRNKVVVYGYDGLHATAQASPPADIALPAGFYKAVVISYPNIIDTVEMAAAAAEYNLELLNRATESLTLEAVGNPDVVRGQIVDISQSHISGLGGNWFVYEATHRITPGEGYKMHVTLTK